MAMADQTTKARLSANRRAVRPYEDSRFFDAGLGDWGNAKIILIASPSANHVLIGEHFWFQPALMRESPYPSPGNPLSLELSSRLKLFYTRSEAYQSQNKRIAPGAGYAI